MYYKRHELQWRLSLLYVANIVAVAVGGVRNPSPLLDVHT